MRLINVYTLPRHGNRGGLVLWSDLMKAPVVDAVPVIRCKDCKHRFEGKKIPNCCEVLMEMSHWLVEIPVEDEWHCGNGERKEE